ncbi:MAG: AAA family ATPase [Sedimentisphaerales bacterium]|jgi:ABC-type lipoprotein export system ATPase subunit
MKEPLIKHVEISNYRSCLNCSFDLHPHLSVLIGPNASGKTNILNAILILKKLAEQEEPFRFREGKPVGQSKFKMIFNAEGKKIILNMVVQIDTDENNSDVVLGSHIDWYLKDFTGNAKRYDTPLSLPRYFYGKHVDFSDEETRHRYYYSRLHRTYRSGIPEPAMIALMKMTDFANGMRYYGASQFTNPGNCPVSFEIEKEGIRSRGLKLRGHDKFLFDLYNETKTKSSGYKHFFDIIGPSGLHLIDGIKFAEIKTSSLEYSVRLGGKVRKIKRDKMLIVPRFTIGKHVLSPNQLSEGTFKTIALLFYLVTEASSLLLIEEPEVCIHHGLLSSIIELIKSYSLQKQIIISTHSDFVLDQMSPENVYKISSTPKKGTKIEHIPKSMSGSEFTALKEYLAKEGNLGEYWKHGALEY